MYQYTQFDKQFVQLRAQQFRDQLDRWQRGELTDEQLLPLRLQNGWYIQRYAPMARIAVPYGEISSTQLHMLARIARDYDKPTPELLAHAQATQDELQAAQPGLTLHAAPLQYGYGHFTTRTNVQFNWIPITKAADVMDLLASVGMHGIRPAATPSATSPPRRMKASRKTASSTRAPSPRSHASGARCTPSSRSFRASSRSRSTAPPKTAPPPAGTTSACRRSRTVRAKWALPSRWAVAWAARPSSAP